MFGSHMSHIHMLILTLNSHPFYFCREKFVASIQETDYSTPALKTASNGKGYWYYTRFDEGEGYPRYCRAPQNHEGQLFPPPVNADWDTKFINADNETVYASIFPNEEVYLDVPALARNKTYLAVGAVAISSNQKYIAYSLDVKGGETCQLYVKRIESGETWPLHSHRYKDQNENDVQYELLECDGTVVWNDASDAIFYLTMDDKHRPNKLLCRKIFDSDEHWIDIMNGHDDELLLEEKDELFNLRISKSFDGKYLLATCSSKESSEIHHLDLQDKRGISSVGSLVCIAKRQPNVLYRVTHCEGYWLVQTNLGGLPNLSLKACLVDNGEMKYWHDVVSVDTDIQTPVFDGGHARSLDVSSFAMHVSPLEVRLD